MMSGGLSEADLRTGPFDTKLEAQTAPSKSSCSAGSRFAILFTTFRAGAGVCTVGAGCARGFLAGGGGGAIVTSDSVMIVPIMKPMVSNVTSRVVIFILLFRWFVEQESGPGPAQIRDVGLLQRDAAFHETILAQEDVAGKTLGSCQLSLDT